MSLAEIAISCPDTAEDVYMTPNGSQERERYREGDTERERERERAGERERKRERERERERKRDRERLHVVDSNKHQVHPVGAPERIYLAKCQDLQLKGAIEPKSLCYISEGTLFPSNVVTDHETGHKP